MRLRDGDLGVAKGADAVFLEFHVGDFAVQRPGFTVCAESQPSTDVHEVEQVAEGSIDVRRHVANTLLAIEPGSPDERHDLEIPFFLGTCVAQPEGRDQGRGGCNESASRAHRPKLTRQVRRPNRTMGRFVGRGLERVIKALFLLVPGRGLEPPRCYPLVPETSASTNSATRAGVRRAAQCTDRLPTCQFVPRSPIDAAARGVPMRLHA